MTIPSTTPGIYKFTVDGAYTNVSLATEPLFTVRHRCSW
jgi:hypothetical protein